MTSRGRVTMPIEQGMDDQLPGILSRLGADAVRNSDGTWLPEITPQLGVKVYETYFPARGNQEFLAQALANLLDNAVKYTPSGGAIMLRVRRRSSGHQAGSAGASSGRAAMEASEAAHARR